MNVPVTAFAVATVLGAAASTAIAETPGPFPAGPLPAGKPAGVQQAQQEVGQMYWILGVAGLVGIGVALATSTNGSSPTPTTVSTTSTSATP